MKPLATANVALRTIDWDNLYAVLMFTGPLP
jgi:hypothetical protein